MKKMRYTGATDAQVNFGNCDDPRGLLSEGTVYDVDGVDVHSWHTKIKLSGVEVVSQFEIRK